MSVKRSLASMSEPVPTSSKIGSFFNLRWRLTLVYIILFTICVIIFNVLISYLAPQDRQSILLSSAPAVAVGNFLISIRVASVVMIVVAAIIAFFLTGVLLRPLRYVIDAAHAIALGDRKQRVRLPQGKEEVGELGAILNEMVNQIEHAFEVQQSSERRARRFVSNASHQLRTPLTSLRGFTEVLMHAAKDSPEAAQRVLKLMKNETERMTRLVNDMLTLARLDEGSLLQRDQQVDLVAIAIEGVEEAKVLDGDERRVSLELATEERLVLRGDTDRLKQVLFILVDNALKYSRPAPEGWILLRLDKQDDSAIMQVIDNGRGIAPEDLPHIFERFYRGEHSFDTSERDKATPVGGGLGLAIAKGIVDAHEGDIAVRSEINKGTVFMVTLPCAN